MAINLREAIKQNRIDQFVAEHEGGLSISIDKNSILPYQYPFTDECRTLLYSTILKWNKISLNEKIRN